MPITNVHPGAYFVIDVFSYRSQIQEYDPHVTNQTLLGFDSEPDGGVAVLGEGVPGYPDDSDDFRQAPEVIGVDDLSDSEEATAREELKRTTPSNAELRRLAKRFPAPQEWYDE